LISFKLARVFVTAMGKKGMLRPEVKITPAITPSVSSMSSTFMNRKVSGSSNSLNSGSETSGNVSRINRIVQERLLYTSVLGKCYNWFYSSNDQIGKKRQVAKIMFLLMLPIAALAGVTIRNLVDSSNESKMKSNIRDAMRFAMETGSLIDNLQKERDRVALFISSKSSETRILIEEIFRQTDLSLAALRSWNQDSEELTFMTAFESKADFQKILDIRRRDISLNPDFRNPLEEIRFYTNDVIRVFINWITDTIQQSKDGSLWKNMVAYLLLVMAKENTGVERSLGGIFYAQGGFRMDSEYQWYLRTYFQGRAQIKDSKEYSDIVRELTNQTAVELAPVVSSIETMRSEILSRSEPQNMGGLEASTLWLNNMSIYMEGQQGLLVSLGEFALNSIATDKLDDYNSLMLNLGFFLIALISSPIVIFIVHAMMDDISQYSGALMTQACAMTKDRERADRLLYGMMPQSIIEQLRLRKKVSAETFTEASIMLVRLANFAFVANNSQPGQVIEILNGLYNMFDERIEKFDCHKLQTSGDWLLIVSGVPIRNGRRHAHELAVLSIDLRHHALHIRVAHMPGVSMHLQIAIHSGPVVAAVVGVIFPRYCLFGTTLFATQSIEAQCEQGTVLISEATRNLIAFDSTFVADYKKTVEVGEGETVRVHELKTKKGYEESLGCSPNCQGDNGTA
uniref:Guanylate cyclase domain-containing protein n=2 Tax=Macrostomum lignano TaxID=282301 RepID=A0A1I8HH80_9PLAT